jgi:hypothetical protein
MSEQLILIEGLSASGKTLSLNSLADRDSVAYFNCENKRVPFRPEFKNTLNVTDPYQVHNGIRELNGMSQIKTVIIDTIDFLMNMFETNIIKKAANGQKAWGDYFTFFQELMQVYVAQSDKTFIFLAHAKTVLDEAAMMNVTSVPVKGALKDLGVESFFTTVIMAKQVPLRMLEGITNSLLNVNEDDTERGVKYVFQTRMNKASVGEKIRSPHQPPMWAKNEIFIDNNAQHVVTRLNDYYGGSK